MRAALAGGALDLEEGALVCVRLSDVDDEVVREHELRQRVYPVAVHGPVDLPVEAVPESEVCVQPCAICGHVSLGQLEDVLHVVEVANFEVAVHRVELLWGQHQVLHLGPAHAFDSNVELASRQGLRHHPDKLHTVEDVCAIELDDEAKDVLAVEVDRARIGEREPSCRDRLQRGGSIHDERIPAWAGEDANAVGRAASLVVQAEGDRLASRGRARALLSN